MEGDPAESVSDMTEDARAFLAERHPHMLDLCTWLAAVVEAADPDLVERIYPGWDGIGYRHPDGGLVCAIYPQADHVRLFFEHGRRLADPVGILEGDGRQTRFVHVERIDERLAPALKGYVAAAVAQRLFAR